MTTVRPWSMRQSAQPTVVLRAPAPPERLLEVLGEQARALRWNLEQEPGALVVTRGVKGGYLLSEVAQLPLMTVLQRVELVADAWADGPGAALRVTCRVGASGLGVGKRVARLLDAVVRRLAADGVAVQVGEWSATPE